MLHAPVVLMFLVRTAMHHSLSVGISQHAGDVPSHLSLSYDA